MAKSLQIFVFALALTQGFCAVAISTFPAFVERVPPSLLPPPEPEVESPAIPPVGAEVLPLPLPSAPVLPEEEQPAVPPCVSVVKSILQAIIDKLENLPEITAPLPEIIEPVEDPSDPESPETPEVAELPQVQVNPCTACFEHISSLLVTAQRLATLKALTRQ